MLYENLKEQYIIFSYTGCYGVEMEATLAGVYHLPSIATIMSVNTPNMKHP